MNRRYRVVANMYAINMLASVRSMTKGIVAIDPTDAQGNPITNFYDYAIHRENGKDLKEWLAFADYLASFPKVDGVAQVPERYRASQGRKIAMFGSFPGILMNPGMPTLVVLLAVLLIVAFVIFRVVTHKKRKERRQARKAAKKAAKKR